MFPSFSSFFKADDSSCECVNLPGDIWQPLSSKTGPLQSMSHNQIVKKRSVFLPYFIFFIYHPLLHRVIKCSCNKKGRENKMRSVKTPSMRRDEYVSSSILTHIYASHLYYTSAVKMQLILPNFIDKLYLWKTT